MFILEGKLTFINIEQSYLKKLHDACSEVYYKPSGYENKPYIGILINKNDRKYVIPLSTIGIIFLISITERICFTSSSSAATQISPCAILDFFAIS